MITSHLAALIEDTRSAVATTRLGRMLDFLGIPWQAFRNISHLAESIASGSPQGTAYSVVGSLTAIGDLFLRSPGADQAAQTIRSTAHSTFAYLTEEAVLCEEVLRAFMNGADARLLPLKGQNVKVQVTDCCPDLTGPMHGLQAVVNARPFDKTLSINHANAISKIIAADDGVSFFSLQSEGLRTFVSCSSDIPDLKEPLKGRWYDVKEHFLCAVPLFIYLKWAFRDVCWQANELGACLIVDDPVLKTKYGFCNFPEIDNQMREFGFSTNISFIPWNWRRTSDATAALMRESNGRFSISIHGCDHTGSEFATSAIPELNRKVTLAKQRMERHRQKSAVFHDPVMVFPQGAFSRESLAVLQQHQFLAAVNTEVLPMNGSSETATIEDVWKVAITKYGGFPVFTRRYPSHGLENFAFDLLLGKPCLIVEHHEFFKGGGREAIKFINALNSLNCRLQWRSLGQVVRRSYQWRTGTNGGIQIRMFANELILHNPTRQEQSYYVEKVNEGSAGIEDVSVNGCPVKWEADNASMAFSCKVPPNVEVIVRVHYRSSLGHMTGHDSVTTMTRTALRRCLSEFRDTFLSRHDRLMLMVQKAKGIVRWH